MKKLLITAFYKKLWPTEIYVQFVWPFPLYFDLIFVNAWWTPKPTPIDLNFFPVSVLIQYNGISPLLKVSDPPYCWDRFKPIPIYRLKITILGYFTIAFISHIFISHRHQYWYNFEHLFQTDTDIGLIKPILISIPIIRSVIPIISGILGS